MCKLAATSKRSNYYKTNEFSAKIEYHMLSAIYSIALEKERKNIRSIERIER